MADYNITLRDDSSYLSLGVSWLVENDGGGDSRAGLKVTLIEKKSMLADVEWLQWTPLAREGGPGLVINITEREMPGHLLHEVSNGRNGVSSVPGHGRQSLSLGFRFPGPAAAGTREFWRKHSGASFKLAVEMIELDDSLGFVRSLKSLTFNDALRVSYVPGVS